MTEYKVTIKTPNSTILEGVWEGSSKFDVKLKVERLLTVDSEEGLWVRDTFLPEDVIKNSIFKIEEI